MIAVKHIALALLFAGNLCFLAIASNDPLPPPSGRGAGGEGRSVSGSSHQAEPCDKKMFPDGVSHDFGKVKSGLRFHHTFRIVNTSKSMLNILFIHSSSNCITVEASKKVLQPGEDGKIVVTLNTDRFRGTRVVAMIVLMDNGKSWEQRCWVKAHCEVAE